MTGGTILILSSKKSSFKVHLKAVSLSKSSLVQSFYQYKEGGNVYLLCFLSLNSIFIHCDEYILSIEMPVFVLRTDYAYT